METLLKQIMPRLFKTDICYRNIDYSAIVTISNVGQEKKIFIELPDQPLQDIIPGGKITLDGISRVPINEPDIRIDPVFVESLWKVVDLHESNQPETSLWS